MINLKPSVVVILAGTNEIAGNMDPSTFEKIDDIIIRMTQFE